MADTNVVKNWVLKVMQQKITEGKGCMLNCALNGRKNPVFNNIRICHYNTP